MRNAYFIAYAIGMGYDCDSCGEANSSFIPAMNIQFMCDSGQYRGASCDDVIYATFNFLAAPAERSIFLAQRLRGSKLIILI
jgi:hypothetical protein